jgi:tripartite-type tricarboxylate transporter receptor subunit TctC
MSAGVAAAEEYPDRPVRMIVPFSPGGANDIVARLVSQGLHERWGIPVVIDNRPGAGGNVGTGIAARANADGYTLLVGSASTLAANASLYTNLPFDPLRDFAPVSLVATAPYVLVANPSLPARSVRELVALAKASPKKLNYSTFGEGSSAHLVTEMFQSMAGIGMVHVPYKGGSPALTAVISGEVDMTISNLSVALPQIKAGKVRGIAVTSAKRSAAIPDLPPIASDGFDGFDATAWIGIVVPAGVSTAVIQALNNDIHAVVSRPEMKKQLDARGLEPALSTPAEFARHLRGETKRWADVIRGSGMKRL